MGSKSFRWVGDEVVADEYTLILGSNVEYLSWRRQTPGLRLYTMFSSVALHDFPASSGLIPSTSPRDKRSIMLRDPAAAEFLRSVTLVAAPCDVPTWQDGTLLSIDKNGCTKPKS